MVGTLITPFSAFSTHPNTTPPPVDVKPLLYYNNYVAKRKKATLASLKGLINTKTFGAKRRARHKRAQKGFPF
jgi:hypothetical protein